MEAQRLAAERKQGIGVPKNRQASLFRAFYQVNPMVQPTSGMGLDLYLSQEVVRWHGGRVWFVSEEGKGSAFSFTLPMVS